MPHSSSGFGEIKVNRMYLVERETAKESNDKKLSLEGQESSPPTTVALVTYLHGQISGLEEGRIVPVTFRDKAERDGYYIVGNTNSELVDYQGEVATATWTIDLERIGSSSEVDLQSRLTGAIRQNDFALTGSRWHAPPIAHYTYDTGSTLPSGTVTRSGADGDIDVYFGLPANVSPKWGCAADAYGGGRVRINDTLEVSTENEMEGLERRMSTHGWTLANGLLNLTPSSTGSDLDVQYHDGSNYVSNIWRFTVGGVEVPAWTSASILRNDFEMCVLRLMAPQPSGAGRVQVDLTLRRGARFVEGYMQSSVSSTLRVVRETPVVSTSGTGYVVESAGTHRVIVGSARTYTEDLVACGISKASTTALGFWLGVIIDAAAPASGDAPTDLRDQYIGTMPEITYAIGR